MKLNQKLLERLDESLAQSFVQKYHEEKNKKVAPEQFISDEHRGNFRVRAVGEKSDQMKKSKLDAMSTATSNFYKEASTPSTTKPLSSINTSKLLDQSKVSSLKQSILSNRITSAQPGRPLMIKKQIKPLEQSQVELKEQKPPIFAFKRLSSAKQQTQQQQQDEEKPALQSQEQSLNSSLIGKSTLLRRSSQTSQQGKKIEIKKEDEQEPKKFSLPKKQDVEQQEFQFKFQMPKKQVDDQVYDIMDTDTLQEITKKNENDFDQVTSVQFRFNTMNDSLYTLGEYLPNLLELKLNSSQIESLRLLGTKLRNLQILWISNSKLVDMSGIMSMPNLVELYCSFNNIKDISPLAFHEKISILDIEGNELADESQIEHLESLNLQQLIISSNPLVKNDNFRNQLYEKLPATEIYIDENEIPTESQVISDNNQIDQLYHIAEIMDSQFDIIRVGELRDLEVKVRQELENQLLDEPDESRLLSLSIKQKPFEKQKLKRPQTAQVQYTKDIDPTSELVGLEEAFAGNPLKAAQKYNKNKQQFIDPTDRKSIDIQTLLKQFK